MAARILAVVTKLPVIDSTAVSIFGVIVVELTNTVFTVFTVFTVYANFGGDVLMNRRGELGGVRIERQQYRRWGAN